MELGTTCAHCGDVIAHPQGTKRYCSPSCKQSARWRRKYVAARSRRREEGTWTRVGFVYAVQEVGGGPIKIGWTKDLTDRLERLQTGNPRELAYIGTGEGSRASEAEMHRRFAGRRKRGEWFEITRDELFEACPELDPA